LKKDRESLLAFYDFRPSTGSICGRRMRLSRRSRPCATALGHHETQPASPARTAELAKIDAEIAQTVGDDSSWRRPTLYVLEALAAQRTAALSFMLNAQSTQSVSGVRELSVLVPTSS